MVTRRGKKTMTSEKHFNHSALRRDRGWHQRELFTSSELCQWWLVETLSQVLLNNLSLEPVGLSCNRAAEVTAKRRLLNWRLILTPCCAAISPCRGLMVWLYSCWLFNDRFPSVHRYPFKLFKKKHISMHFGTLTTASTVAQWVA